MLFKGGYKMSEEHKRKISIANKNKPSKRKGKTYEEIYGSKDRAEIEKKKRREALTGRHLSESAKEKLRVPHINRKQSKVIIEKKLKMTRMKMTQETKNKISNAHKGKKKPWVSILKRGKSPFEGMHHTKKEKLRRSELMKNRIVSEKTRMKMSLSLIKRKKDPNSIYNQSEFKERLIKSILKGLIKRPTSYEKKISNLCIEHNLPFVYTGDGRILIGYKNPDFVDEKDKVVIEVFLSYFKIRDYGSIENYMKQRSEHFSKYGYKTIFINEKEILDKNWNDICLNKIKNFIENEI